MTINLMSNLLPLEVVWFDKYWRLDVNEEAAEAHCCLIVILSCIGSNDPVLVVCKNDGWA